MVNPFLGNFYRSICKFLDSYFPDQPRDHYAVPTAPASHVISDAVPDFVARIYAAINQEPVEDGFEHPAEEMIRQALSDRGADLKKWMQLLISRESSAYILASVIKCLARATETMAQNWCYELMALALTHRDVQVRDAAIQSLETWGTQEALELLRHHSEPVVWLNDYIDRLILQSHAQ